MKFLTVSSQPLSDPRAALARESADRYGINMEVLVVRPFDWEGRQATRALISYLPSLPASEIVLCSDLWDVFFCGRPEEIERKFLEAGKDIVFSAEAPPLNDDGSWGPITWGPTRWTAVNGGGLIGRAGALLAMFTDLTFWRPEAHNNQVAYRYWLAEHGDIATLDNYCRIFQPIYDHGGRPQSIDSVIEVCDGRIYNRETNSFPCQMHGHGRQLRRLRMWWDRLNADPSERKRQLRAKRRAQLPKW